MMILQNRIVSFQNHMNKCFNECKQCPGRYMLIFKAPYLNTESWNVFMKLKGLKEHGVIDSILKVNFEVIWNDEYVNTICVYCVTIIHCSVCKYSGR